MKFGGSAERSILKLNKNYILLVKIDSIWDFATYFLNKIRCAGPKYLVQCTKVSLHSV